MITPNIFIMKPIILITLLQFLSTNASLQEPTLIVKITLFYESLCPYCHNFITQQLYPGFEKVGKYLDIHFVPYGNANHTKVDGKWQFECQHGPEECWDNKAHGCGLAEYMPQDNTVKFVNCMMLNSDLEGAVAVKTCSPKLDVKAEEILQCVNSEKGDEILAKYGEETQANKYMNGVPALLVNDVYDEELEEEIVEDFLRAVCKLFLKKPKACPESDSSNDN